MNLDPFATFRYETPEAGGGGEAPSEGEGQPADVSAITSRLDEFSNKIGERFDALEGHVGMGEQEFVDPYGIDENGDGEQPPANGDGTGAFEQPQDEQQQQIQALQQFIDERTTAQIAERLSPLQEQIREQDIYTRAVQLEDEFPELQNPETAQAVFEEAISLGHSMGLDRDMARDPEFVGLVYRASRASSAADGETPAGEQDGAALEMGAGGAQPSSEEDPAMSILNAGPRRGFLTGA